jgi:hypothetical protein
MEVDTRNDILKSFFNYEITEEEALLKLEVKATTSRVHIINTEREKRKTLTRKLERSVFMLAGTIEDWKNQDSWK